MRRAACLLAAAARRAHAPQPAPAHQQLAARFASFAREEREREDVSAWAGKTKARGGAKAKQWSKYKGKETAAPPAEVVSEKSAAAVPAAAAAVAQPPPSVAVPDRVTVRQLAKALNVTVSRVEVIMAQLDDAPASDEECVCRGHLCVALPLPIPSAPRHNAHAPPSHSYQACVSGHG